MAHSDYVTGPLDSEPNTILIVDDDPITRLVLGEIFKSSYDIQEAEDGRESLSLVLADPMRYCAILLDFAMEGMDGLEVLRAPPGSADLLDAHPRVPDHRRDQ